MGKKQKNTSPVNTNSMELHFTRSDICSNYYQIHQMKIVCRRLGFPVNGSIHILNVCCTLSNALNCLIFQIENPHLIRMIYDDWNDGIMNLLFAHSQAQSAVILRGAKHVSSDNKPDVYMQVYWHLILVLYHWSVSCNLWIQNSKYSHVTVSNFIFWLKKTKNDQKELFQVTQQYYKIQNQNVFLLTGKNTKVFFCVCFWQIFSSCK